MKSTHTLFASFVLASALIAIPSFAEMTVVPKTIGFLSGNEIPAPNELFMAYDLKSSNAWSQSVVDLASPFSGFKSFETWIVGEDTNETVVYKSEASFVVEKGIDQMDLSRLTSTEFLTSIDPGFEHKETSAQEFNDAYQKAMTEGLQSAKKAADLLFQRRIFTESQRAQQEEMMNAQHEVNLSHTWCQDAQVKCLVSKAQFPASFQIAILGLSFVGDDFPSSLDLYSELRELTAEELQASGASFGIIQTSPLANKTMVSMKNIMLFKKISDTQTLVTIESLAVFEKDDLDRFQFAGSYDFIVGTSIILTRNEGIAMGLPAYGKNLAIDLKSSF